MCPQSPFRYSQKSVSVRSDPFRYPESPFRYSESPFRYPRKSVSVRSGPFRFVSVNRDTVLLICMIKRLYLQCICYLTASLQRLMRQCQYFPFLKRRHLTPHNVLSILLLFQVVYILAEALRIKFSYLSIFKLSSRFLHAHLSKSLTLVYCLHISNNV